MPHADEPKRSRFRSLLPRLFMWAGVVALVIALGIGADMYMGKREAAAALARIRARGEPTSDDVWRVRLR